MNLFKRSRLSRKRRALLALYTNVGMTAVPVAPNPWAFHGGGGWRWGS